MSEGLPPVLRCTGLRKSFGDLVAVDGVGFQIAAGETYGLLGPNGAGKTTSIAMACGLLEPDGGEVRLLGEPLTARSVAPKRAVGYVPQDIAIYPDLTARENLAFFGRLYGLTGGERVSRIDEALETVGLSDRAGDKAGEYSGGMKRRLNIAIGLLHGPKLLVLDEPTVGVDPQSRNSILESVERLGAEGLAVLYTTHYMEEAERLCDRVGIIDHGRIVAEGTRDELVRLVGEHDRVRLTATGELGAAVAALQGMDAVREAGVAEGGLDLIVEGASGALAGLLAAVASAGATVTSVDVDQPDLEAVFLHLTGRALRD
ncbi:MAG: ABC transporter ATP-binding protein [Coriobacteriia bacterium]|nr:ABC transporter ATP-binding protein [Coriobacteriia bacterium]